VVGVGDARKIAPVLAKYGTVQIFDVQGKPEEVKMERMKPVGQ
jgi:hypothetical protein